MWVTWYNLDVASFSVVFLQLIIPQLPFSHTLKEKKKNTSLDNNNIIYLIR